MESLRALSTFTTPIAVVTAGIIIAGAVLWSGSKTAASPPGGEAPPPTVVDTSTLSLTGEPFIGNPDAPVTMVYWYDYQCPFCQRHELQTMPQIVREYVATGKLKIVFKDYQFLGPGSQTLGTYSRAVWEVTPGKFYDWHKAVYENQGQENSGWATEATLSSITATVLGAADAATVTALAKTKAAEYQDEMDADRAEGTAVGITGTPGSVVGMRLLSGALPYTQFKEAIEEALK